MDWPLLKHYLGTRTRKKRRELWGAWRGHIEAVAAKAEQA
jgi:hypothetical protein